MNWARLDALAGRASARQFGERVKVVPKSQSSGRLVVGSDDPERSSFEITATLDITDHSEHIGGDGSRTASRQDLMLQEVALLIEAGSILPPNAMPKVGDYIVALERPGSPAFKIATPAEQNGGRYLFMMVPV